MGYSVFEFFLVVLSGSMVSHSIGEHHFLKRQFLRVLCKKLLEKEDRVFLKWMLHVFVYWCKGRCYSEMIQEKVAFGISNDNAGTG